jgi:hypothetical protein
MTVVLAEINNEPVVPHCDGDDWSIQCGLTLSSTYKTGGDTTFKEEVEKVLKELGAGTIIFVCVNGAPGYVIQYNYKTGKLQVFRTGAAVKGVLEELPEEEYPAALREAGLLRVQVTGK